MIVHSPGNALLRFDGIDTLKGTCKFRWDGCLHADFDGFKRTETNIGDEFGGCRTREVDCSLVLLRIFLARQFRVQVLEVFVETILGGSLHRVAEEGWGPTSEDPPNAFSAANQTPCLEIALVQVGVDLTTTFD